MINKNHPFYIINQATTKACRVTLAYMFIVALALAFGIIDQALFKKSLYWLILPFAPTFICVYLYLRYKAKGRRASIR